jgi:phage-related protein
LQKWYIAVQWTVTLLNESVAAQLAALPADVRARFSRIVDLIAGHGLERVREPHVKHLRGRVWEMRMSGRDGIARALYVTAAGKRVVVVHMFEKKTQKTPRREIEIAEKRSKEVL